MKKILFIHPNLNPLRQDGAYTRLKMFTNSLHESKFNVSILVLVPIKEWFAVLINTKRLDKRFKWYILPSFSFYTIKSIGLLNRWYASFAIAIIVWVRKFRLIQCELSSTMALTKLCPAGVKYISDFHADLYPELEFYNEKSWKIKLAKEEAKYAILNSDFVITVSSNLSRHLQMNYSPSFKNGIQSCLPLLKKFDFNFESRKEKRIDLGIENRIVIGYSGGLQAYQCIEESIYLFKLLQEKVSNLFFLIYTCGDLELINAKIKKLGLKETDYQIKCISSDEIPNYLSLIDIGLLLREEKTINLVSSPTKGLEYLAAGNAILTTKSAGNIPDLVGNSKSAFILPSLNFSEELVNQLSEYLTYIKENRYNVFLESKAIVQTNADWEKGFDNIKHIYVD